MKNILCFGDSNTWGCKPIVTAGVIERYAPDTRWPGVMRNALGPGFTVIEEGQNARTTVFDDPIDGPHKNGRSHLLTCLETHIPLDLVIFMLGTNDLKSRFSVSAFDVASGLKPLIEIVNSISAKNWGTTPETLIIAPPPFGRLSVLGPMFAGGAAKSADLAAHFHATATSMNAHFLDAGAFIKSSDLDGIHFDAEEHRMLGETVTEAVQGILAA
ncbi:MAG: SGNH/GDSL hydrolase family protein [Pseudomonadota bacterium]